ncbi:MULTISPECIES: class I SAM-dependent methyltransferase [Streptomyces]|uniref:class I SAM-dependent methyltransferase n=1 Tax=Streptomyces TaxID=1883 RepID=UPI001F152429|nr:MULTISPECIES: class I SAM-dependent methyltransferase [Streptomyces]
MSSTQHERAVSAHVDVPNVEFVQADVTEYLAKAESFDAAYAIGTLAFIDPHRSLPALRDGLRPRRPTDPLAPAHRPERPRSVHGSSATGADDPAPRQPAAADADVGPDTAAVGGPAHRVWLPR